MFDVLSEGGSAGSETQSESLSPLECEFKSQIKVR